MTRFPINTMLLAVTLASCLPGPAGRGQTAAVKAPGSAMVKLRTGQEFRGELGEEALHVQLPYGELMVPSGCLLRLWSESPDRPVLVELTTGERFFGRVVSPADLTVQIEAGKLLVPFGKIALVERAGSGFRPAFAEIPSALRVDALYAVADRPGEVLAFTESPGAFCGGGTPCAAWRVTFQAADGAGPIVQKVQDLAEVQQVRGTVFRASDGTLFTGGGWGGPRPPYYSTDAGKTWKPANAGGHPPNSTFCFCEFKGKVYAGAGYEPHHGQVYRWLGEGRWQQVLDVAPPRSIISSMAVHEDKMFVSAQIYWAGAKNGSNPVYVTTDGERFIATTGLPDTHSVGRFLNSGGKLLAYVYGPEGNTLYCWNGEQWLPWADCPYSIYQAVVDANGVIYITATPLNGSGNHLYKSADLGKTWQAFWPPLAAAPDNPAVVSLAVCGDDLYVGSGTSGPDGKTPPRIFRFRLGSAAGPSETAKLTD